MVSPLHDFAPITRPPYIIIPDLSQPDQISIEYAVYTRSQRSEYNMYTSGGGGGGLRVVARRKQHVYVYTYYKRADGENL